MMLIGDKAQLPPVGESESPALLSDVMQGYALKVYECDLNEVLRQNRDSGILYNATLIRRMITHDTQPYLPCIRFATFADIIPVSGSDLIESLGSSYAEVGTDETIVITRSNKRANIFNRGIRTSVLGYEEMLTGGEMLMIVKNNYHFTQQEKSPITFLANGDRACVQRVRNEHEAYGLHFAEVWLQLPDYDNYELQATVVLDSLLTESPALTPEQNEKLYQQVMNDYSDIPLKTDRIKRIKSDRYFNAVQIKYAYAITCHKAQGGQWEHVYLDQGYITNEMLTPDYLHWLYTAFTRARTKLFLINWPEKQVET